MTQHAYILVHLAEPHKPGFTFRRYADPWPLHITLVPWFSVPESEAALVDALRAAARTVAPSDVQVGAQAMFGPNADIPVNVIDDQVVVRCLHLVFMDAVESQQAVFNGYPYVRSAYHGHITRQTKDGQTYGKREGEIEHVSSVTLVRLTPDEQGELCEVVATFPLGVGI